MKNSSPPIKAVLDRIDPLRYYPVIQMWSDIQAFPWMGHYRQYQRFLKAQLLGTNKWNVQEIKGVRKHRLLMRGEDILRCREERGITKNNE